MQNAICGNSFYIDIPASRLRYCEHIRNFFREPYVQISSALVKDTETQLSVYNLMSSEPPSGASQEAHFSLNNSLHCSELWTHMRAKKFSEETHDEKRDCSFVFIFIPSQSLSRLIVKNAEAVEDFSTMGCIYTVCSTSQT